ncbi:FKBP14 [Cervus elaphus hippelaphus]|uniref:peptidylprolyl isomerase n=1 Tax=Cervus elaphus hippelaphus TaxID=46360 RepID=A0A212CJW4_CEREH|nr:FKBP14 [Cervus elaphus hippelaphus]
MRLFLWNAVLTLLVTCLSGALIPEPEVKIEVLQKPFICHRKTKGGDLMLVHYEGYLEKDGSLFHSTSGMVSFSTQCKIPPESTLIFNIDLLEIRNGPRSHESFQEMDLNDDWKLSKNEVKVYLKKEFEKHGAVVNESHHDVLVEDIFDKEDEDKDGFISAREFTYKHDEL